MDCWSLNWLRWLIKFTKLDNQSCLACQSFFKLFLSNGAGSQRFCSGVNIGHAGHEIQTFTGPNSGFQSATHVWKKGGVQDVVSFPKCFHLYDRVGKPRVGHEERYRIPRIPAILELCIQAGIEIDKYPTKRRRPVYCIEGRIVDFEMVNKMDRNSHSGIVDPLADPDAGTNMEELRNSASLCVDKSSDKMWKSWTELSSITMRWYPEQRR